MKILLSFFFFFSFVLNAQASKEVLEAKFREYPELKEVKVELKQSTAVLTGSVYSLEAEEQAKKIANSTEGIETVLSEIKLSGDVTKRAHVVYQDLKNKVLEWLILFPLFLVALFVFFLFFLLSRLLSTNWLLDKFVAPKSFFRDIATRSVRIAICLLGLVAALEIIGATSLVGAVLGAAGVIGLSLSFAFKDIIENYVAGLILSIKNPFSHGDVIAIDAVEGQVMRMTTRITVIKTYGGNDVSIPNSVIFKSTIKNYSSNNKRRFDFTIEIDVNFDPDLARSLGVSKLKEVEGILLDPAPFALIDEIVTTGFRVHYFAWIDQTKNDWGLVRSAVLRAVKLSIEEKDILISNNVLKLEVSNSEELSSLKAPDSKDSSQSKNQSSSPISKENLQDSPGESGTLKKIAQEDNKGQKNILSRNKSDLE